jgi:hypothetical protein
MMMSAIRSMGVMVAAALMALCAFAMPAQAANSPLQIVQVTYDAGSLVDAAGVTTTVTVPGAVLGDACVPSLGVDAAGITVTCYISAANTASVRLQNESTATVDLASTTLRVFVFRKGVN